MIDETAPALPADRPRYLMGVGTPEDLLEAVARGIDMFDCVLPTRNGRHGVAFTRFGPINLRRMRAMPTIRGRSTRPARCPAARDYSRAYLHHLVKSGEMLGAMLLSHDQSRLLPGADGRHARRDRAGRFAEFRRRRRKAGGAATFRAQ